MATKNKMVLLYFGEMRKEERFFGEIFHHPRPNCSNFQLGIPRSCLPPKPVQLLLLDPCANKCHSLFWSLWTNLPRIECVRWRRFGTSFPFSCKRPLQLFGVRQSRFFESGRLSPGGHRPTEGSFFPASRPHHLGGGKSDFWQLLWFSLAGFFEL